MFLGLEWYWWLIIVVVVALSIFRNNRSRELAGTEKGKRGRLRCWY